jgi:hypothetical protein
LREVRQFWSRQIAILVGSGVLTVLAMLRFSDQVTSVSPAGLEAVSTGFATLLGLTFTAFSIVATFMPGLRPDFVRSESFEMIGRTFVIAMITEGATFSLATTGFVLYSASLVEQVAPVLVFTAIASLGLLAKLGDYMFSLFRMARQGTTG